MYRISGRFAIASGSSGRTTFSIRLCVGTFHTPAAAVCRATSGIFVSFTYPARFTPKNSELDTSVPSSRIASTY